MPILTPIGEDKATEKVAEIYNEIKKTLKIANVPIFFRLIANFEDYLAYIWKSFKANLEDTNFIKLAQELEEFAFNNICDIYLPEPEIIAYLDRHLSEDPQIFFIRQDIKKVNKVNAKLAFIFIALREAVKGWAVGAKLINTRAGEVYVSRESQSHTIFDSSLKEDYIINHDLLMQKDFKLQNYSSKEGVVVSFYPKLVALMIDEADKMIKKADYFVWRVQFEENILAKLLNIPHPINSSYRDTIKLCQGMPFFDELIYLICDSFPSLAVFKLSTSTVGSILVSDSPDI